MKFLDILPNQETFSVIDQSKLTEYMSCPRKYFYRYVLGWQSSYPNNHLVFGSAWHRAVEHLLLGQYSKESLHEAAFLFLDTYRKDFPADTDDEFEPKDPKNALLTLSKYRDRFFHDSLEYEVLFTEIAGQVYVAPDEPMHFKIDAILRDKRTNKIFLLDHKTSQRRMSNWQDSYILNTQMLLYLHALYCMYGVEDNVIQGAKVRCSFFYKSKPAEFEETLVQKTPAQMNAWLTSNLAHYSSLKMDMQYLLEEESTEDDVLACFPLNTTSCFNYGKPCLYLDLCNAWQNPLQHATNVPLGMKIEFWDPREDKSIREFVDLKPQTSFLT